MQPVFRIQADGKDITALINDRLLLLRTTDKPGMESDDFELRIDARDGAVALPARGALIEVHLGYAGLPLTRLGRYTVDEVELSGPPDTLVIRGKASDLRGSGRTIRSGSWEAVPLQRIVAEIGARNGWQALCPVRVQVPRVDQYNESDFNFITRLARQYDCTAKLADGQLLVLPRQAGQSASGKPWAWSALPATRSASGISAWTTKRREKPCAPAIRTLPVASRRPSNWSTRRLLKASGRCIPTGTSTPTAPLPNKRPGRGWPASTVILLRCAWICRGVPTCSPSAASPCTVLPMAWMGSTRSIRWSRCSPHRAGAPRCRAMAARRARCRPGAVPRRQAVIKA